jgi:pimeloyl-ACP methyl ester carboxylesterase
MTGCASEKAVYRPFARSDRDIFREAKFENASPSPSLATAELPTLAHAQWAFSTAAKTEKHSVDEAIWGYRDAALMADLALAGTHDVADREKLAEIHAMSVRRCLRLIGADRADGHEDLAERLTRAGLGLDYADPSWAGLTFTKIEIASDYEDRNIEPVLELPGWGLPVVAVRMYGDDEVRPVAEAFFSPINRLTATATIRAVHPPGNRQLNWKHVQASLVLHSPLEQGRYISVSGGEMPLAADFTTPSLVQFSRSGLQALEYEGLLLPEVVQEKASIYLNEPYRPGRIPVLFVHGLWSSPRTWTDMNNGLLADPEIRRNYQFFFALYPTGEPVVESAAILRDKFREIRDTFDPARTDPAWDHAVVVGHSMGGIISRLLVSDSGKEFEEAVFAKPVEQIRMSAENMDYITRRLRFQNVPEMKRAVFIAPVFGGSSFASRPLGRISSALVRIPQTNDTLRREIMRDNPIEVIQPSFRRFGGFNGIDNLEPDNPLILAMRKTRPDPEVRFHLILGDNGRLIPRLKGEITDGLVTYSSGHLEGAESELIVKANHYLNHDQPVIEEVGRILHVHMDAIARDHGREFEPVSPESILVDPSATPIAKGMTPKRIRR